MENIRIRYKDGTTKDIEFPEEKLQDWYEETLIGENGEKIIIRFYKSDEKDEQDNVIFYDERIPPFNPA
jgi:hypothetical protein